MHERPDRTMKTFTEATKEQVHTEKRRANNEPIPELITPKDCWAYTDTVAWPASERAYERIEWVHSCIVTRIQYFSFHFYFEKNSRRDEVKERERKSGKKHTQKGKKNPRICTIRKVLCEKALKINMQIKWNKWKVYPCIYRTYLSCANITYGVSMCVCVTVYFRKRSFILVRYLLGWLNKCCKIVNQKVFHSMAEK